MSNLALITARGGSKRIPKKNIKEFCGKPIIAYSIKSALESGLFDEVMVSTDSEEIAAIARQYGASVPFMRSGETANDYASTIDVCREVLRCYEEIGRTFDYFCCLYPTAPFVTPDKLKEAFALLSNPETTPLSVFPVTAFSYPPQRGLYVNEKNQTSWVCPEHQFTRSQDLPKIYHDCGQFYFINMELFRQNGYVDVDETTQAIIMGENEVQDIDTPEDWTLAELKYRLMFGRKEDF